MKTARFAELVSKAGRPSTHQLWLPPAQDPEFQRAVKQHRVLTVHQENVGTKKDFGVVGFHEEPHAQFLIFPRSVRDFEGRRVIGINYDLLDGTATQPIGAVKRTPKAAPKPAGADEVPWAKVAGSAAAGTRAAVKPARTKAAERKSAARVQPKPNVVAFDERKESKAAPGPEPTEKGKRATGAGRQPAATHESEDDAMTLNPRAAGELRRALTELKAGKAVAAYERLRSLLQRAGA